MARQSRWPAPRIEITNDGIAGWTPVEQWLADDQAIAGLLDYQKSFTPDLDRKGQAAYAIGDYSHMLATAFVPLLVGFRMVPDFGPANVEIGFDLKPVEHNGLPLTERLWRLRLANLACRTDVSLPTSDLAGDFRCHVEAHMTGLVEALHGESGLSRSALWRLVGDSISQVFLDAGRHFGRIEQAKTDAMAILKSHGSPLANRQMHYFDIEICKPAQPDEVLVSATYRARGGCCRFYTVEGGHLCATCVLQDPVERDLKLERLLRQRLGLSGSETVALANPAV